MSGIMHTGRLHRDLKELNELDVFETVNIVPMVPATKSTTTEAAEADSDKTQAITDLEYQLAEKSKFGSWTCQGGATVVRLRLLLLSCWAKQLELFMKEHAGKCCWQYFSPYSEQHQAH